jgi:hypothetical protein
MRNGTAGSGRGCLYRSALLGRTPFRFRPFGQGGAVLTRFCPSCGGHLRWTWLLLPDEVDDARLRGGRIRGWHCSDPRCGYRRKLDWPVPPEPQVPAGAR